MNRIQEQVTAFHKTFGIGVQTWPGFPSREECDLRVALIDEEAKEFRDAIENADFIEAVDALGDLLYVVFGAAVTFGVDMQPIVDEIHRSNLTKLDALGRPIYAENGKVIKGPNYEPPDIAGVLGFAKEVVEHKYTRLKIL